MKLICLALLSFNLFAANTAITIQRGFDYRMETLQFGFSYFTDSGNSWEFKVGKAEEESGTEKEEQYNISLGYKIMRGKSAYIIPEISYYAFTENQDNSKFGNNLFDAEEDYRALAIGVRIGNEWIIKEHLLLAVDWVGAGFGTKLAKFNEEASNDAPIHYTLLNLKLGWRF